MLSFDNSNFVNTEASTTQNGFIFEYFQLELFLMEMYFYYSNFIPYSASITPNNLETLLWANGCNTKINYMHFSSISIF